MRPTNAPIHPDYIQHHCNHCGARLIPRKWVFANADDDEWVCEPGYETTCPGMYFDWTPEQFAEVLGDDCEDVAKVGRIE